MTGIEVKKKLQNNGFSLKTVADLMGETPQNLNSMLSAQDIKTGVVERIAKAINKSLYFFFEEKIELMSEAEMAQHDREVAEGKWNVSIGYPDGRIKAIPARKDNQDSTAAAHPSDDGIPLIPLDAVAGFCAGNSAQILEYECERFIVPTFRGAEFLIQVKGSSMYPKYSSGDIVACKKLPLDTFFQWNKVYVVDTEQGVLIKRIKQGKDEDHIILVSENERYDSFPLHKQDIHALAIVIGVIRLE